MIKPFSSDIIKNIAEINLEKENFSSKDKIFVIYRVEEYGLTHTGLIALVSLNNNNNHQTIHKHEAVSIFKLSKLIKEFSSFPYQKQPIILLHKPSEHNLLANLTSGAQKVIFHHLDSISTIWFIRDAKHVKQIEESYNSYQDLYIADGHHRYEALHVLSQSQPEVYQDPYILALLIPLNGVNLCPYNKIISNINAKKYNMFLRKINNFFLLTPVDKTVRSTRANECYMYFEKKWYLLSCKFFFKININNLAIIILEENIFDDFLQIEDSEPNGVEYVTGIIGSNYLEQRVSQLYNAVAFSFNSLHKKLLLNIFETQALLPLCSTCFLPKPNTEIFNFRINSAIKN